MSGTAASGHVGRRLVVNRWRGLAGAVALALVVAACSSGSAKHSSRSDILKVGGNTGQATGGASGTAGSGGTGGAAASGGGSAGPTSVGVGGAAGGGVAGQSGAASGAQAAAVSGPSGAATQAAPSQTPLLIGYYGTQATNGNAFGINGQVLGDPVTIGNAMADWINSHGGAGGHPIKLVVATTPLVSSTPQDQIDQSACAKFTEDNHVFAALSITLTTPTMYQCLAQHNVLFIPNTVYEPDEAWYMAHASTLFSSAPTQDRGGPATAEALWRTKYFADPGARVGVITADHPWYKSGLTAFEQEAAKFGATVAATATVCHTPCSSAEQSQEAQGAVLKFRGAGINHVVILSAEAATAFLQQAEAAGYTPRLGFSSNALPSSWPIEFPPSLLQGAVGAGYMPSVDVARAQNPPLNATNRLCEQIMQGKGINESNFGVEVQTWMTCDCFFLLKAALDRAGRADYGAMQAAIEGLGSSLLPANGFTSWYGPRRHDGTETYRINAFNSACRCFEYVGNTEYPMPPLPGQPR